MPFIADWHIEHELIIIPPSAEWFYVSTVQCVEVLFMHCPFILHLSYVLPNSLFSPQINILFSLLHETAFALQVAEPNPAVPKGVCYVETKSLDGETNLKVRTVMPALLGKVRPGPLI